MAPDNFFLLHIHLFYRQTLTGDKQHMEMKAHTRNYHPCFRQNDSFVCCEENCDSVFKRFWNYIGLGWLPDCELICQRFPAVECLILGVSWWENYLNRLDFCDQNIRYFVVFGKFNLCSSDLTMIWQQALFLIAYKFFCFWSILFVLLNCYVYVKTFLFTLLWITDYYKRNEISGKFIA